MWCIHVSNVFVVFDNAMCNMTWVYITQMYLFVCIFVVADHHNHFSAQSSTRAPFKTVSHTHWVRIMFVASSQPCRGQRSPAAGSQAVGSDQAPLAHTWAYEVRTANAKSLLTIGSLPVGPECSRGTTDCQHCYQWGWRCYNCWSQQIATENFTTICWYLLETRGEIN